MIPEAENPLILLFDGSADGMVVLDAADRIIDANPAATQLFGQSRDTLLGTQLPHPVTIGRFSEMLVGERDGQAIYVDLQVIALPWQGRPARLVTLRDISVRRRNRMIHLARAELLENVVAGASISDVLASSVRMVETQIPGAIGSVLLLDGDGTHLRHGAALHLPPAYMQAIDGVAIGPNVGSCGTAAYLGRPVIVADIATDPLWADYAALALAHGLRACWSFPVLSSKGQVVATMAVYFRHICAPGTDHPALIAANAQILGIALERMHMEADLRANQARLANAEMVAGMGTWQVSLPDRHHVWSDQTLRILGAQRDATRPSRGALHERVHPQDRARYEAAREAVTSGAAPMDVQVRIIRPDGTIRHVHVRARRLSDPLNQMEFVAGTLQDVTEQRAAQTHLRLLEASLANLNDIVQINEPDPEDPTTPRIVYVNDAFVRRTGYSREEILGRGPAILHGPLTQAGESQRLRAALVTNTAANAEVIYYTKTGEPYWVKVAVRPVPDENGVARHRVSIHHDITEQKAALAAARDAEAHLRFVLESAEIGVWERDLATDECTRTLRHDQCFGYTEKLPAWPFSMYLQHAHPDDRAMLIAEHDAIERSEQGLNSQSTYRVIWPDKSVHWLYSRREFTLDETGKPIRTHGIVMDVTAQKAAELDQIRLNRALRMRNACNRALSHATNETALLTELCRVAVEIGGYQMAWAGYAQDDAERSIRPMASAGRAEAYLRAFRASWAADTPNGQGPSGQVIREGKVVISSDLAADPSFVPWREAAHRQGFAGALGLPLKDDLRCFGMLGLYMGEVRATPPEELELLEALAEDLSYGIRTLRAQNNARRMQKALIAMASGVAARSDASFFQQITEAMADALEADGAFVTQMVPGQQRLVQTIAGVLDGKKVENFRYDINNTPCEKLLTEDISAVASAATARFPNLLGLGLDGIEAYVGRRLNDSRGQIIGIVFALFRKPLKNEEFIFSTLQIFAARSAAELQRLEADKQIRAQAALLDKAHDAILVRDMRHNIVFWNKGAETLYGWTAQQVIGQSVLKSLYPDPEWYRVPFAAVTTQGEWRGDLKQLRQDGSEVWVDAHWTLVRDEATGEDVVLCINTDTTNRRLLEAQLQQAQRLETVGQLTGGVAHDFNNLLTVILGNSELLTEQLPADDRRRMLAEMTMTAARRGADLTQRLLAFARRQALEPKVVDVNQLMAGLEGLIKRTLSADIEIRFIPGAELWNALIDHAQLESGLLNLSLNARDAMPGGGVLTIETANTWLDQAYADQHADVAPGPYVLITVTDTGTGIAPEYLGRVFDPFFSTKEPGKGSGLGLSMVFGFVKQSNGHIKIYSELGHGTSIRLYLPRAGLPEKVFETQALPEDHLGGSETILLVEDDELVRKHAESLLLGLGYRVITVTGSEDALAAIRSDTPIDLLFTDIVMPGGMNGRQLADLCRTIRPSLKVLYTSGYTENAIVHQGRLDEGLHLLNKPYRRIDLTRKIRAALMKDSNLAQ